MLKLVTELSCFESETNIGRRLAEMSNIHRLEKYCRVCGGLLQRGKRKETSYMLAKSMEITCWTALISVNIAADDVNVYPQHYYNRCYSVVRRYLHAHARGLPYTHSVQVFTWTEHTEDNCSVSSAKFLNSHNKSVFLLGLWAHRHSHYDQRRRAEQEGY